MERKSKSLTIGRKQRSQVPRKGIGRNLGWDKIKGGNYSDGSPARPYLRFILLVFESQPNVVGR
jgi:hypothetical protein